MYKPAGHLYPTRSSERPIIKRTRTQFFKDIVGTDFPVVKSDFELTRSEFVMMSAINQVNLNYLVQFIDLVHQYGGKWVCLSYFILQVMLGMPLFMLYTFMSSYSKKSYLTFWECVPILEGLGYTIAAVRFTTEMYNTAAAGLALLLLPHIFSPQAMQVITNCSPSIYKNDCIPSYPKKDSPSMCRNQFYRFKNETVLISTQHYLRWLMMYDQFDLTCCSINWLWMCAVFLVWILIFCISIFGIRRIRKITVNLQFVVSACLVVASVYTITMVSGVGRKIIETSNKTFESHFTFWVDMILHAAETNVLGNMIWLGTIKPKKLNPRHAALIIAPFKLLVFILMVCFCSRVMQDIMHHYRFKDDTCLTFYGHDLIFAFIPDVMHRLRLGNILLVTWYVGIFFFSFLSPLYTLIGLVDSIVETYRKLSKYRIFVYLTLCIIGVLMNTVMTLNLGLSWMYTNASYGLPLLSTVILLLMNLALMFIYSTKRIVDDYNYTYGEPPHKYWVTFWRTAPIFSLFAFILMLTQMNTFDEMNFTNYQLIVASYIHSSLMLCPIIILFWTKCCTHVKYRTLGMLSKPASTWGPHSSVKRQARKYFYPQRDVKYRNYILNCMHKCIAHSARFYEESRRQTQKMHMLLQEMKIKSS